MNKIIYWNLNFLPYKYPDKIKQIYFSNYLKLRNDFTNWIDSLNSKFSKDLDWWLNEPSSRNPFLTNLYNYVCVLETLKVLRKSECIVTINTGDELFYNILKKKKYKNIVVKLEKKKEISKNYFFNFFKSFFFQIFLFYFINIFFKKKKIENILINTYPNNNLQKIERLFQLKNQKERFSFVPSFILTKNIFFIIKLILKLNKKNYIFKEHHTNLRDIFNAYCFIFRLKKFKLKYKNFKGSDLSKIIYKEICNFKNFNTYVIGILNYNFAKNLSRKKVNITKVFSWFENHELKGWNMGFRSFFPLIKSFGYQGVSPMLPLMNSIPSKMEVKFKVIPETIICISAKYKSILKEFCNNINIKVGPNLIFRDVFSKYKKKRKIKYLVVLNEFKEINYELIDWINFISLKMQNVLFYIKLPKVANMSQLVKKNKKNKKLIFTNIALSSLLKKTKNVFTTGLGLSSIAIESLAYTCKVLVPVINPLDKVYFEKLKISKKLYTTFESKKELLSFIKKENTNKEIIPIDEYNNFKKKYFSKKDENFF